MATVFQKLAVDFVHNLGPEGEDQSTPLDYPNLKKGGFRAVYFRPEEGVDVVSQRINYAVGQGFDGNLWVADPKSEDSIKAGIPTGAQTWIDFVVGFVKKLRALGKPPRVVKLNIEFSGKGYPPWKPNVVLLPWSKVYARVIDPIDARVKVFLFNTPTGGQTGSMTPKWSVDKDTRDGQVTWQITSRTEYKDAGGWIFNELAAKRFFSLLPDQPVVIQPMSMQEDFNHAAWMLRGARNSMQCYGSKPYFKEGDPGAYVTDPNEEIEAIVKNRFTQPYYGYIPDRRRIHPTIGAYGQGGFYVPKLKKAWAKNVFGIMLYRHDNLRTSDYEDYRRFVVP